MFLKTIPVDFIQLYRWINSYNQFFSHLFLCDVNTDKQHFTQMRRNQTNFQHPSAIQQCWTPTETTRLQICWNDADMIGLSGTESFWPETSQMKPAQLHWLEIRGTAALSYTKFWNNLRLKQYRNKIPMGWNLSEHFSSRQGRKLRQVMHVWIYLLLSAF